MQKKQRNNTAFIGPANADYVFPITLLGPEQDLDAIALLKQTPPAWLIIYENGPELLSEYLPGAHLSITPQTEAEIRQEIFNHYPLWFNYSTSYHASVVCRDNHGILIRGKPGSGKTRLMIELVSTFGFKMVADDAPDIYRVSGQTLFSVCPPNIYRHYIPAGSIAIHSLPDADCQRHCNLKMAVYLDTKNIQNRAEEGPDMLQQLNILDVSIPEWVLQPGTVRDMAKSINQHFEQNSC